jgi:acyl dehydratase
MTAGPIDIKDLVPGYEFPPAEVRIGAAGAAAYLRATEGEGEFFEASGTVPPMAVAALAMAAMGKAMALPGGTVHVSQEVTFHRPAKLDEALTSRATVTRRVARGKINMMNVGLKVVDREEKPVMTGETSFLLPAETGQVT